MHTLGSPPLLEALLQRLFQAGARLAEPGEFTLRAFLCNRIDLTQAEAVLGVIDAATPRQFQVALNQLAGGLARPLRRLRDCLLDLLADLEAGLDFADEDLELLGPGQIQRQLAEAAETVAALRDQMARRGVASPTSRVAIIGWPNTGKSSLFNALLGRAGAIVSDQAGTTRDYLTAELDLDGVRVVLVDTAGVEPASRLDPVTGAAQAAGAEQAATAQLRLLCIDSTRPLNGWERAELRLRQADRLIVLTKCDLPPGTDFQGPAVATSSLTGHGLQSLWGRIREAAVLASGPQADVVAATARRCTHSLRLAAACLDRAAALAREGGADELVASEIRVALDELGQVVGAVYTEDLLDRVFSRFCIGK
ncbi:MAG TPA: GTP-binding protein [Planctomycetes bacterium]|nr:GTP-binding protein [Planctomycetota bacterium]